MEQCECGKKATTYVVDSEVGADVVCDDCFNTWISRGNINEATVWESQPLKAI